MRPSFTPIAAAGAKPHRWILVAHGLLGSGANWRTIARRLTEQNPIVGALLVDLRLHGNSLVAEPPHTIEAAAADLGEITPRVHGPIEGILGHSLGGKVALSYAKRFGSQGLRWVWSVDSPPGCVDLEEDDTGATRVLRALRALPPVLPSRAEFVRRLQEQSIERGIAQWLAMNLRNQNGGVAFGPNLDSIEHLRRSFAQTDMWSVLEDPPNGLSVHLILGRRSRALSAAARGRAVRAAHHRRVRVSEIAEAGHWVHVDAPEELLKLIAEDLKEPTHE